MSPKGPLGYRMATQLDPIDTLLLTSLIYEVGAEIEHARVPRSQHIVFSHRFEPDENGTLYSREFNFDTFRRQSLYLANRRQEGWVVLTDIADFYVRLYAHPLENALKQTVSLDHARVIFKLLKQLNQRVSYGIPVGPAATRLLAELAIIDIDSVLVDNGILYCRYSDDFRLFAHTEAQAYEYLALLARVLHSNHGLTLQESKTAVIPAIDFIERFQETEDQRVQHKLDIYFDELVELLGVDDYHRVEYDDLDPDQQEIVDGLDLIDIVRRQINRNRPVNASLTGFVLRRLAQVGNIPVEFAVLLLTEIERLVPVFGDVISVLTKTESGDVEEHSILIDRIIELMNDPYFSHLEYYRAWLLTLCSELPLRHPTMSPRIYDKYRDSFTRSQRFLLMGIMNKQGWIRTKKPHVFEFGEWERRALLRAASSLPPDEAKAWFNSVKKRLGLLDQWVIHWARGNPLLSRTWIRM